MLARALFGICLCFVAWGCGSDNELPPSGARPGASQNGVECQSAGVCKGGVCLSFDSRTAEGYCSENCEGTCHYGGECVASSEFEGRRCLIPCETRSECEGDAYCQPVEDGEVCTSEDDCEESGQTYCILQY